MAAHCHVSGCKGERGVVHPLRDWGLHWKLGCSQLGCSLLDPSGGQVGGPLAAKPRAQGLGITSCVLRGGGQACSHPLPLRAL